MFAPAKTVIANVHLRLYFEKSKIEKILKIVWLLKEKRRIFTAALSATEFLKILKRNRQTGR